ncbi:MAG: glutamine cyclotransferase [Flammeovirgaceae bacterium]|nr:glutamine cyclotransferase [Flammeovirgaceae bacterium]MBR10254.1 glutamine cyclotransferase [Rickettsiales bacterium]
MAMNYTYRIFIILAVIFLTSCGADKETTETSESPRIKNFSKVILPESNQEIIFGGVIDFEISSSQNTDSIILEYGDEHIKYSELAFSWTPKVIKTGKQKVKIKVYAGDQVETHYARVVVLSDITPASMTYEIIAEYPHSEDAFLQGLFFIGDTLVESTGQKGQSKLSKLNLKTGETYQSVALDNAYFGEGSTIWENNIYYLTWTSNVGFIYNRNLKQTGKFNYTHEGWGMATMGDTLVVSDGKEVIHFLDPRDLSEIGTIEVYDQEGKITNINELEYFNGLIYANIWQEDVIITIDPSTGRVMDIIDMRGLEDNFSSSSAEVLNGIAYKRNSDQIFVSGKNWPKLFEVKFKQTN